MNGWADDLCIRMYVGMSCMYPQLFLMHIHIMYYLKKASLICMYAESSIGVQLIFEESA